MTDRHRVRILRASVHRAARFLEQHAAVLTTEAHWQSAQCPLGYEWRELMEAMRLTRRPRLAIRRRP